MADSKLFQPVSFRSVTARNRIAVSPMCQYSAEDGVGTDWHVQNLGAKAMGGPGFVFTEATHVSDVGRITPGCLGLWNAPQLAFHKRLVALARYGGAVPGVQIAHAGRKASSQRPWDGGNPLLPGDGGWLPLAPSALPFTEGGLPPHALSAAEIAAIVGEFAATARLAREAGYQVVELHGAHGYLIHSFLSPIANVRTDAYGGDLKGRARLLMETLEAVRGEWPSELPLFVRLSCSDYAPGGLTADDAVELSRRLKASGGVDLIDCSSGGVLPTIRIPSVHPGYQVPFADRVRREAGIATGAVGMIREAEHAEEIIANGRADLVFVARAVLADPGWPLRAAEALGARVALPAQYHRAWLAT